MQANATVPDREWAPAAHPADESAVPAVSSGTSRALVPIHSAPLAHGSVKAQGSPRASAPFLAHLIAVERGLPQMRLRRRAAPADAVALYCATLARAPVRTGRKLRRSA